jgi:hypothetical protein
MPTAAARETPAGSLLPGSFAVSFIFQLPSLGWKSAPPHHASFVVLYLRITFVARRLRSLRNRADFRAIFRGKPQSFSAV